MTITAAGIVCWFNLPYLDHIAVAKDFKILCHEISLAEGEIETIRTKEEKT